MSNASESRDRTGHAALRRAFPILLLLACLAIAPAAQAALVRQLEGSGQFHTYIDVVNRWSSEDRLDVLILVEVGNADLGYRRENGKLVGRLNLEVEITGPDGRTVQRTHRVRTAPLTDEEAGTRSLSQVFGLVLEDVPLRSGRLVCEVVDVTRRREGVLNRYWRNNYTSRGVTDWFVEDGPRAPQGLSIEDPLFLVHAPFQAWNPDAVATESKSSDWLHDYVHPSRRYGIEQESLQLVFPVWPAAGGILLEEELPGLRVQAYNLEMTYALNDTIRFDRRARQAMLAGRPAWVFYEMDVNQLPEGSYQLSLAPLGGQGRAVVTGFDVNWRIEGLGRHRDLVLGEGSTIFAGEKLEQFLAASLVEQEKMLELFWAENDPDPDSPINSAYLEFQSRVAYVISFLGGFGPEGARDDRGQVHLLLGPPDEIQTERLPMNFRDQDDARIKVFDRYAPDRESVLSKGTIVYSGQAPHETEGGVPMPYSRLAEAQRQTKQFSASHNFGFELWKYDSGGYSLFPNRYSMTSLGARFLFVDRSGAGHYELESSNLVQGDN